MDFNDVGHFPDQAATEGCPSMKEQKDTPDGHLFETEGSTFVGEVQVERVDYGRVGTCGRVASFWGPRPKPQPKMNGEVKIYCRKSKVLVVQ
jgi:hypothetical protein